MDGSKGLGSALCGSGLARDSGSQCNPAHAVDAEPSLLAVDSSGDIAAGLSPVVALNG